MLNNVIIFALINTAILICLYKWNVVDFYQKTVRWPQWCEFCFCFWLALAEWLCYYANFGHFDLKIVVHIFFYSLASAAASVFFFKP